MRTEQGTADEQHWQYLSRSLERVSTMTDGAEASFEVKLLGSVGLKGKGKRMTVSSCSSNLLLFVKKLRNSIW